MRWFEAAAGVNTARQRAPAHMLSLTTSARLVFSQLRAITTLRVCHWKHRSHLTHNLSYQVRERTR